MDLTNKQLHILNKLVKGAIGVLEGQRTMKGSIERLNVLYELDIATKTDGIVEELKPCPFCASDVSIETRDTTDFGKYDFSYDFIECKCMNILIRGEIYDKNSQEHRSSLKKLRTILTTKWNTRGGN